MNRSLFVMLLLASFVPFTPCSAQQSSKIETAFVYKPDGTEHCDAKQGVSLDAMAQELIGSDISLHSSRKSYDGREGIAVCGNPTGGINVYEIAASDLPLASQLGFQRLDPSPLDAR